MKRLLATPNLRAAALLGLMVASFASPAAAQDNARASREREALRRTQQALKEATEQRSTLRAERDALLRDKAAAEALAKDTQALLTPARAQARAEQARAAKAEFDLATLRQADADAARTQQQQLQALQAKLDEASRALATARAELNERTRTLASVTALLERNTQALAAAEDKNRKLYAQGRELIAQVRDSTGADPVLGLGRVEAENRAELARDKLEADRIAR
ncbi:hypothetical protein BH11PSE9_BH11PSE9_19510 [soil metagenome]